MLNHLYFVKRLELMSTIFEYCIYDVLCITQIYEILINDAYIYILVWWH